MKKVFKRLMSWLKPYTMRFTIGQIAMFLGSGASLAFPWALRELLDTSFTSNDYKSLIFAISFLVVIEVIAGFSNYIKNINLGFISQKVVGDLRVRVYEQLQKMSIDFYKKRNSGEIVSRMTNDINLFQQALTTGLTYILQMAITLLVAVVMLVNMDVMLTVIVFVSFPIMMLVTKLMSAKVKGISKKSQENLSNITAILNQSVSGIGVIKAFGLEKFAKRMFGDENKKWLGNIIKQVKIKARTRMVVDYLRSFQLLLILGVGAYRVFSGDISTGTLIAFILYSQMLSGPVGMFSEIYVEIQRAMAAADRIFEILDYRRDIVNPEEPISIENMNGRVNFENVSFSYDVDNEVIKGIDFAIEPGQSAAFVGMSGAGKTTVFNFIPRFYDVSGGSVTIDGIDVRDMDMDELRSKIAIVPQDTYLFEMSIKDNIGCGKPNATEDEIIAAAKLANAHDFIMEMPDKYETVAGEGGTRLSGGQRQRVAIARAFLKNPRILLLDEATSALDTHSERIVQKAIERLMKDRTTLVIAHRLSTIINADVIFVMEKGRIISQGTHSELLDKCERYRDLYRAQEIVEGELTG